MSFQSKALKTVILLYSFSEQGSRSSLLLMILFLPYRKGQSLPHDGHVTWKVGGERWGAVANAREDGLEGVVQGGGWD
jgi:hypothetical protein